MLTLLTKTRAEHSVTGCEVNALKGDAALEEICMICLIEGSTRNRTVFLQTGLSDNQGMCPSSAVHQGGGKKKTVEFA